MRRMNKRGQAIFVGIMIFIVVFISIIQFINPLKEQVITARNPDNLDCTNSSISVGQEMACVVVDVYLFYFLGTAFAAGSAWIWLGTRKKAK